MATAHFSKTHEYKIVNPEPCLFLVCFRRQSTVPWNFLSEKNSLEQAIAVVSRNIKEDNVKANIEYGGIDFDLNPKPEPEPLNKNI